MKKLLVVLTCITLLAGCSIDSLFKRNENVQQEEKNPVNYHEDENKDAVENNDQSDADQPDKQEESDKLTLESIYFNDILEVDNKKVIQNPTNIMVLVNHEYALPGQYAPEDLVRPNVAFSFGNQDVEKSHMRKAAAEALEKMFVDAANNGIELLAVSGYRSYNRQKEVFDAQVSHSGYEAATKLVAIPGNSEHQTGLSMDISSKSAI